MSSIPPSPSKSPSKSKPVAKLKVKVPLALTLKLATGRTVPSGRVVQQLATLSGVYPAPLKTNVSPREYPLGLSTVNIAPPGTVGPAISNSAAAPAPLPGAYALIAHLPRQLKTE